MPSGFVPPCIPTRAIEPPAGADCEIKHDGYRLQVRRQGDVVRLFTRNGYDWSARYPAISVTTMLLRAKSFVPVAFGPDGVAVFGAVHRHQEPNQDWSAVMLFVACTMPTGLAIALPVSGFVTLKGPERQARENGRQRWPAAVNTITRLNEVQAVLRWLATHQGGPLAEHVYRCDEYGNRLTGEAA